MVQITTVGCQVAVVNSPDGLQKILMVNDPQSGLQIHIPMTLENAKTIGAALTSSVLVAARPLPPVH